MINFAKQECCSGLNTRTVFLSKRLFIVQEIYLVRKEKSVKAMEISKEARSKEAMSINSREMQQLAEENIKLQSSLDSLNGSYLECVCGNSVV